MIAEFPQNPHDPLLPSDCLETLAKDTARHGLLGVVLAMN